jgi:2-C-methyl-D-erythritol 4-phosphate cytidylyltransferase/2-C-methyl-D-erythritol 2,4-cyclodiphosphate synthase
MSVTALIVAAGKGERLGGDMPKQYRLLGGKPVLRWAVENLARHPAIRSTRVVVARGQEAHAMAALEGLEVGELIAGGTERADSVRAGLSRIASDAVMIHDAARPFCPPSVIDRLLASLEFHEGASCTRPSRRRHACPRRTDAGRSGGPEHDGTRPDAAGFSDERPQGRL